MRLFTRLQSLCKLRRFITQIRESPCPPTPRSPASTRLPRRSGPGRIQRDGRPYGRKEAAEELARLITEASQNRDEAEPGDERFFSSGLEAHELGAATPAVTTEP